MSINCAAIPQNLIESELFGYEGGSFTGAAREGRPGKIELADGGTLFLDEIGDMPFDLQSTLLRVLESKSVMRLGAKRYKSVDFRVISATNRDLLQAVREGKFREDLYYRLSVLTIELPPLRERRDDILFFVRYYLDNWNSDNHAQQLVLSDEAMELLLAYEWPGNIRQLRNCLLAACHLATNGQIEADDLPAGITSNSSAILSEAGGKSSSTRSNTASAYTDLISEATSLDLEYVEQKAIAEALRRANGNMTKAARLLGVSKATLYRKIKE
jgi:transcriptional regulator with PAS, ATPase and Fis domain